MVMDFVLYSTLQKSILDDLSTKSPQTEATLHIPRNADFVVTIVLK